jgi:hypothetical protein
MAITSNIRKVEKLIGHLESELNSKGFIPRSNLQLGRVLLALLSKSIVTAKAACVLVKEGYYEEAFAVTRTMADLYFTVRYITNKDPLDRAEKFANFFAKNYQDWIKIVTKYYPHKLPEPSPKHDELMKLADSYPNPHKWTGMGDQTRQMAAEASTHEGTADGKPVTAGFDYEVIYKWASHFVHPTVVALETHAVENRELFRVYAGQSKARRYGNLALFNVVVFLAKIFICGMRGLRSTLPPDVPKEWDRLLRAL